MSEGELKKRVGQISEWLKVDLSVHPMSPIAEVLLFKEKAYLEMLDEARKECPFHILDADDDWFQNKKRRLLLAKELRNWFLKWFGDVKP